MSRNRERQREKQDMRNSTVDQLKRVYSPLADGGVKFEINQVSLLELIAARGAKGIIFRSQPGGGKSHTIERFRHDMEEKYGSNILLRSIKWSDRLRDKDILGNRKPRADSLTPEKRRIVAERFLQDATMRFADIVRKERRGKRIHPRGLFTIAEVPDGVVDDGIIQSLVNQGFVLIDLVPDPAFQRQAMKERQLAWDSDTGELVDVTMLNRRQSAPPEVMAMSIKRSRQFQRSVLFPEEGAWEWLSQIPIPNGGRRRHDDRYHMARSALSSLIRSEMQFPCGSALVAYNRRAA